MKCGHCGNPHETVDEVRVCWADEMMAEASKEAAAWEALTQRDWDVLEALAREEAEN